MNLAKWGIYIAVDIYFYTWAMLVYFEETEWRETVRGRYCVFKNGVK